jgi:hypothetical protein
VEQEYISGNNETKTLKTVLTDLMFAANSIIGFCFFNNIMVFAVFLAITTRTHLELLIRFIKDNNFDAFKKHCQDFLLMLHLFDNGFEFKVPVFNQTIELCSTTPDESRGLVDLVRDCQKKYKDSGQFIVKVTYDGQHFIKHSRQKHYHLTNHIVVKTSIDDSSSTFFFHSAYCRPVEGGKPQLDEDLKDIIFTQRVRSSNFERGLQEA